MLTNYKFNKSTLEKNVNKMAVQSEQGLIFS